MLKHLNSNALTPSRVVVIGAGGFLGSAIASRVANDGIEVCEIGREDVDLLAPDASTELQNLLKHGDSVVAIAAIAPAKNHSMVIDNMKIAGAIVAAISAHGDDIAHVINVSSDAVYADTPTPLNEASATAPDSYHGIMHLAREVHFQTALNVPLTIIRPTLVYGADDPHNGYGPNKFRRLAANGDDIVLFGEGEERRDHVLIDDVAELVMQMLLHRSAGKINAATGHVSSFREIAELVNSHFETPVAIHGSERNGAMPHNGFRPFDITACQHAFPMFSYTPLEVGLKQTHEQGLRERQNNG